ncbi:MAG TPA: non-homologous end-joining DNA ligase [Candidatus Limnocylindria bacterium]|nr:non-homologous end-joining DNA ligase [Candidatus Limnocylindria bacterium]
MGAARVTDPATIGGVVISNANKVWWPDEGITKGDIARFYHAISSLIIPWMRDRPLTAERCPDGMLGGCFYRKNFPEGNIPVDAPRLRLRAASTGKDVNYLVGGTMDALLGLVRVGCISMHVMNSRVRSMHEADWLAFDLDPSSGEFSDTVRAGTVLRAILDEHKLVSYPKTSGSRGLHVFVPLRPGHTQEDVTAFAVRIGEELARREPDLVTMSFSKSGRGDRVYADPFRNTYLQTIVPPYSVRRRAGATVSMPVAWDEVNARLDPRRYTVRTLEKYVSRGDPWSDFRRRGQKLPA